MWRKTVNRPRLSQPKVDTPTVQNAIEVTAVQIPSDYDEFLNFKIHHYINTWV
jgi:hypothetical protein